MLRRGRMSGNPDVLEYYQSKNSKKPIRTIDLKECEVEMLNGQLRIKRDFNGKHLFVVKTSARIFYLVAKTEEEMNGWISSISQICQFGSLEDAGKNTQKALIQFSLKCGRVEAALDKVFCSKICPTHWKSQSMCGTQKVILFTSQKSHPAAPEEIAVTCPLTEMRN